MEIGDYEVIGDYEIVERRHDSCSPWSYDVSYFHDGLGWQYIISFETAREAYRWVREAMKHPQLA